MVKRNSTIHKKNRKNEIPLVTKEERKRERNIVLKIIPITHKNRDYSVKIIKKE